MFNLKFQAMKKLFLSLAATFLFGPCLTAQNSGTSKLEGNGVECSDFHLTVSVLFASISTTVYVCCGTPFVNGTNVPCQIVPKKTYELYTNRPQAASGNGMLVSDLFENSKTDWKTAKYIDVTASSKTIANGKAVGIKKGRYTIDGNGMVYLELEYL